MLEESDSDFLSKVYYYTNYETKNWRKILKLGSDDLTDIRRVSWLWPTEEDLTQFGLILKKLKISTILSIGCGCGFFEWILRESIGVNIFGLERDRCWWKSHHAVKNFIKLNYIDDLKPSCLPETFLQTCCDIHDRKNWKFAAMFCYFNNRSAFESYLEMYKGSWIILCGPLPGSNIHTDPLPLEPNFPPDTQWKLYEVLKIGSHDVVAIYRNEKTFNQI